MIENDIRRLDGGGLDRSLDQLEADIWRGVAARSRERAVARKVTILQGVVMAFALLGSIGVGIGIARPGGAPVSLASLTTGSELMPSTLLLGEHP